MVNMKFGDGRFRLYAVYALLGLCVLLSPACEKKAPSGPAIGVPTFTRQFSAAGKEYHYTVVGRDPAQGGTTTISTVLVPGVAGVRCAGGQGREKRGDQRRR